MKNGVENSPNPMTRKRHNASNSATGDRGASPAKADGKA